MKEFGVVDAHIHIGNYGNIFTHGWHFPDILHLMDRFGIERAYSSHHQWLAGQLADGRDASIRAYDKSGGRISFMGIFDPREEDESLKMLRSCLDHAGFIGIKIHPPFHEVCADDDKYRVIWDFAEDHDIPIVSHTWSTTENPSQELSLPKLFEVHIKRHPGVRFVMAHSGGRKDGREQAIRLARDYPNVYLDTAGDIFCLGLIEQLVREAGEYRVIYGSDQPWVDVRATLARTYLSDITDEAKLLVLRKNALRVFEPHLLEIE